MSLATASPLESLELFFDNAPCGLLLCSGDGIILRLNRAMLRILRRDASDIVNKARLSDLMTVSSRIYYETHYAPLLQIQGAVTEIAVDLSSAEGRQIPAFISSTVERAPSGEPLLIRTAVFEAQDRRSYEREMLIARRTAEQALQAKTDFLAMFAHEVKNGLAAISMQAQMLARTVVAPEQHKPMARLRTSLERLLVLIENMLDISRIDAGRAGLNPTNTNLRDVLSALRHTFAAAAESKQIDLTVCLPPGLPTAVYADAVKLEQTLANLVGNAIKFTSEGGVEVGVDVLGHEGDLVRLRFWVKDTGIGITAESQARIFEPYVQADSNIQKKFGGTGLGLAISRKLIELHGGKLKVESAPTKGSTFSFELRLRQLPQQLEQRT